MVWDDVNEKFAKWARSFSGFEGGNIDGSIWFCGIEWGGDEKEEELQNWINKGPIENPPYEEEIPPTGGLGPYPYRRSLLKLYSSILGRDTKDYMDVIRKTSFLTKDSDTFKLNLYPISFKNTDTNRWKNSLSILTGLPNKSAYWKWCREHRFPKIKSCLDHSKVKIIICTGISYAREFLIAFSGTEETHTETVYLEKKNLEKKKLIWAKINSGKNLLFVVPFPRFGRYCLTSDKDLSDFGAEIKKIADLHFGSSWHKEYPLDQKG